MIEFYDFTIAIIHDALYPILRTRMLLFKAKRNNKFMIDSYFSYLLKLK